MNTKTDTQIINDSPTTVKPVAIYCRVSTDKQENEGTSLDSQRDSCKEYCKRHGYTVTYQFLENCTGLSLDRPQLYELRRLIWNEEISAVIVHSLDRLSRDPAHGVILTEELEKHNIKLEAVTETVDSTEIGKLINYIRGYAAKAEVEKIRERTQRGLKSRVFEKRLPVTYRQPYGYSWDKQNSRLVPNENYDTVKLILNLALNGKSYDYIMAELKRRVIPSSTGLPEWNKAGISSIIRNPVYIGMYHAFKTTSKLPEKRNGNTHGKSSVKRLPQDQWHHIPEIEVVDPPMTADQRALLLDQIAQRQRLAQRNANRDYLLRGMVFCDTHRGKKGEMRVYHGQPLHKRWRYSCPVGRCDSQYIDGPEFELCITYLVSLMFLIEPADGGFYKPILKDQSTRNTSKSLQAEIKKLRKENEAIINKTAKLEDDRLSGKVDIEVYEKLRKQYDDRRSYCKQEQDRLLEQLTNLKEKEKRDQSLESIKRKWNEKLKETREIFKQDDGKCRPAQLVEIWRELLTILNLKVIILPADAPMDFGVFEPTIKGKKIKMFLDFAIPIEIDEKAKEAIESDDSCPVLSSP